MRARACVWAVPCSLPAPLAFAAASAADLASIRPTNSCRCTANSRCLERSRPAARWVGGCVCMCVCVRTCACVWLGVVGLESLLTLVHPFTLPTPAPLPPGALSHTHNNKYTHRSYRSAASRSSQAGLLASNAQNRCTSASTVWLLHQPTTTSSVSPPAMSNVGVGSVKCGGCYHFPSG